VLPLSGLTVSQGTAGLTVAVKFAVPPLPEVTLSCCGPGFCVPVCHTKGGGFAGVTLKVALAFTVSVTWMVTASEVVVLWAVMLPE